MRPHSSPLVIGHRGACGYRPEHTRSAFEFALQLGADLVEPDIVATKDGVLVLRHENEISTTTDVADRPEFAHLRTTKEVDGHELTGWFTEDFTWPQLATLRARERLGKLRQASASFDGQYPILKLEHLFDLVDRAAEASDRELGVVAELKHATYFESIGLPLDELFADVVQKVGWQGETGRLVVESFEKTVLRKVRERGIRGTRVYLVEADGAAYDLVAKDGSAATPYAEEIGETGLYALATRRGLDAIEGISVDKALLLDPAAEGGTTDLVDRAHAVGLAVFTWTLRPENRFLSEPFRAGKKNGFGRWQDEFRTIMATGVDGVFADHPDLALVARDSLG
ncbi:glycerophosphodiester phosphodiesterase family protein [Gryllotalpicola ginsengisoli]|uniref:glycerophosphodiester phosphodiesterase family protein n=1 Tax=Gryllotalpicola ginsengisoli TaxID=444608 RepID=UPI0003B4623D|nr:glycerophosphodiester phosphodiesterase family protein [Gryllotalpicola ginsengisoli]